MLDVSRLLKEVGEAPASVAATLADDDAEENELKETVP
jgi:hypothetical protein